MSNTWVRKIRKNEIIRSRKRNRKAEEAEDTVPPPKLEVKLIVKEQEQTSNVTQSYIYWSVNCAGRKRYRLKIKSRSKTKNNANLMGLQL